VGSIPTSSTTFAVAWLVDTNANLWE
jgi:hypothetical protein